MLRLIWSLSQEEEELQDRVALEDTPELFRKKPDPHPRPRKAKESRLEKRP